MQYELNNDLKLAYQQICDSTIQYFTIHVNDTIYTDSIKFKDGNSNILPYTQKLQLKRDLEKIFALKYNDYSFDVYLELNLYLKNAVYYRKHEFDGLYIILTCGLLLPFLIIPIIRDTIQWYFDEDYYYIYYKITRRKYQVISDYTPVEQEQKQTQNNNYDPSILEALSS